MASQNLPEFWQKRANKAYHQGYNGESRFWNRYEDENANQIPDWIEQTVESYRLDMLNAWKAGVEDRQYDRGRNEPYAQLEMHENQTIQLASHVTEAAPTSGLPSEVDKKPPSPDQVVRG